MCAGIESGKMKSLKIRTQEEPRPQVRVSLPFKRSLTIKNSVTNLYCGYNSAPPYTDVHWPLLTFHYSYLQLIDIDGIDSRKCLQGEQWWRFSGAAYPSSPQKWPLLMYGPSHDHWRTLVATIGIRWSPRVPLPADFARGSHEDSCRGQKLLWDMSGRVGHTRMNGSRAYKASLRSGSWRGSWANVHMPQ